MLGVTTVAGNQTLDKTTVNALKVLELRGAKRRAGGGGGRRPLVAKLITAADAHGETGLDGPALPMPRSQPLEQHAVDFLAEPVRASDVR